MNSIERIFYYIQENAENKIVLLKLFYVQFLIHVLWFRHPVSLMKQRSKVLATLPWIGRTT